MTAKSPRVWERQEGESAPAYAAFRRYRDLGPDRSLRAAWNQDCAEKSEQQESNERATIPPISGRWTAWSQRWAWVDRCRAYDCAMDHAAAESEAEEMRRRGVRLAEARQDCARQLLLWFSQAGEQVEALLSRPPGGGPTLSLSELERVVGLVERLAAVAGPLVGLGEPPPGGAPTTGNGSSARSVVHSAPPPCVNPALLDEEQVDAMLIELLADRAVRGVLSEIEARTLAPPEPRAAPVGEPKGDE